MTSDNSAYRKHALSVRPAVHNNSGKSLQLIRSSNRGTPMNGPAKLQLASLCALVALIPITPAIAKPKTYESGTLAAVNLVDVPLSVPDLTGKTKSTFALVLPMVVYRLSIRSNDVLYVGQCLRKEYQAEWRVNDPVQFRVRRTKFICAAQTARSFHSSCTRSRGPTQTRSQSTILRSRRDDER